MTGRLLSGLGATLLALASQAQAQAYQCSAPSQLAPPRTATRPADEPRRVRPITGYSLALSWSPEFCRTRTNAPRHAMQCDRRTGEFGFVLHGLWPENGRSDYPQWCAKRPAPIPPQVVRRNLCMMPSLEMLAHEWAKHGSCMVERPDTYFRISAVLFDAIRYPDMERLSRRPLTIGMLAKAFADANPGLEPDHVLVETNSRGWLQQLRICLDANFRPERCAARLQRPRGDTPVKIWRGL